MNVAIIIAWAICSVISYGITLAYFQRNWPSHADEGYWQDVGFALFFSLFGPAALIVALFKSGLAMHGLQYRRNKPQKKEGEAQE
jgi:hypothetical protein